MNKFLPVLFLALGSCETTKAHPSATYDQVPVSPVLENEPTRDLRIAFLTDLHIRACPEDVLIRSRRALSNALLLKPDLIVLGGDLVHETTDIADSCPTAPTAPDPCNRDRCPTTRWQMLLDVVQDARRNVASRASHAGAADTPIALTLGNHEMFLSGHTMGGTDGKEWYRSNLPPWLDEMVIARPDWTITFPDGRNHERGNTRVATSYTITPKDSAWRVVILDDILVDGDGYIGSVGQENHDWVMRLLESTAGPAERPMPSLIFSHIPIESKCDSDDTLVAHQLPDLAKTIRDVPWSPEDKRSVVIGAMSGHLHKLERRTGEAGILWLGGGAVYAPPPPQPFFTLIEMQEGAPGQRPDLRLTYFDAVAETPTTIDEGTIGNCAD